MGGGCGVGGAEFDPRSRGWRRERKWRQPGRAGAIHHRLTITAENFPRLSFARPRFTIMVPAMSEDPSPDTNEASGPMLTFEEARVLGCLLEKEITTPD